MQSLFATGFTNVNGIALDSSNNLFVTEYNVDHITKITPGGAKSIFASGLGQSMRMWPSIAVGTFSFLISPTALFSSTLPDGSRTFFAAASSPNGLAIDSSNNVFVSNTFSGNIYKDNSAGMQSTFASGLASPVGLALDASGNLFESDFNSGHIYEFTPNGVQTTFASGLSGPFFLAFTPVAVPETSTVTMLAGCVLLEPSSFVAANLPLNPPKGVCAKAESHKGRTYDSLRIQVEAVSDEADEKPR